MGKIQGIKTGFLMLWKTPKGKINPTTLRYVPNKNISPCADEFIHTIQKEFSTLPREVSKQEVFNFRQYMLMKKTSLKITKEEFRTLLSYDGEEYKLKAYELLTKKMNIPHELMPQFIYSNAIDVPMFYDFRMNYIAVNPSLNVDKGSFLAYLRHELQHFSQNMQMFRHETKGAELAKIFSKMNADITCKNIDHYARNVDIEQLKQILNEEDLKQISFFKDLLKNNQIKEYDYYLQLLEKKFNEYHLSEYTDFRKKIIDAMGILKKDTKEGKRAEKMFNETVSEQGYWQADGQVHLGKYLGDCRECEAFAAQDSIMINISEADNTKRCYMRDLKQTQEFLEQNADKNVKLVTDLAESINEMQDKGLKMKDLISYLYD